jgi:hypothetical protein
MAILADFGELDRLEHPARAISTNAVSNFVKRVILVS